jgi:RNA polymerase sigma factor (sigma-70 family)
MSIQLTGPVAEVRTETSVDQAASIADLPSVAYREVLSQLVDDFEGMLWGIARGFRLSDADAADVAQTAWMRLMQNFDRLEDPSRVGGWLATTARRECLRKIRANAREIPDEQPPEPDAAAEPSVDDELLQAERAAALWCAFGRLGPRDQSLLRLLVMDPQPSYEEIGMALDMPIGSIGPTRARALARLRQELEQGDALADMVAC